MVLAAAAALWMSCGTSEMTITGALGDEDFVKVTRSALTADGGADGYANGESFYVAVNRAQLGQKWFLSAYLTQWHPAEAGLAARSLGTRVVTFKVQNDRLYVFEVTDGATWSDALDPQRIIEAYPLVKDFAPFNAQPGAGNYVLFDPSAGLNRFDLMSDDFAASYSARFEVELSYLQRYRALADGISFEQVFTGYTEAPGPGVLGFDQPFRGQGTMAISLRRYTEGAGFTPSELTSNRTFASSNVQYVPNQPRLKRNAVKWNIKPGMQPIPWRIGAAVSRLENDPRLAGVDVRGAIARGITGWNEAFGFPVFSVVATGADDSVGDDDKNFVLVDTNPGLGFAFANWRENPNTGEIRGASVYFSSVFVESALRSAGDGGAPEPDAGTTVPDAGFDAGTPCAPTLVIAQAFGGNSTTGFRNQDFVVLHNRTSQPVSLAGQSLQYGSATGTSWQVIPLQGTVAPNSSFLVAFASSADGGTPLPTPDQVSPINLSASGGKLALVQGTTALSGACPTGGSVIDLLGYGAANCSEARPVASPGTANTAMRSDFCADGNDNGADFVLAQTAPRNAASGAAAACACTSPVFFPFPPGFGDGGVSFATPPSTNARPSLGWGPMRSESICSFEAPERANVPAGMTRKAFLEKAITSLILHEVGHTLGLRHNFKGSLQGSSVMDYLVEEDAVLRETPGAYDVAAVRQLYGLSTEVPTQAFCTDEDTLLDAQCDRHDRTANPLTDDLVPAFRAQVRENLAERSQITFAQVHRLSRYVRAAPTEAQRLEAFNAMVADLAPPLSAEVQALGPNAAAWANQLNAAVMKNLFVDPVLYRDPIGIDPPLTDAAFRARVIAVARDSLMSSDGFRSFDTMRVMVDVLKAMQTPDALAALTSARAYFATNRAAFSPEVVPLVDDLIRRMDLAMSPYFR
jgi:hypothetical protein